MEKSSLSEGLPSRELTTNMEELLASREELAGLVSCILDWDFTSGPFIGVHLAFEYADWGGGSPSFSLSLERLSAQNAVAWRGVHIKRAFTWGAELPFAAKVLFRRGGAQFPSAPSPHQKDRCLAQASFAGVFDALSAARASIPDEAFTRVLKP